jgi:hypothetical protein
LRDLLATQVGRIDDQGRREDMNKGIAGRPVKIIQRSIPGTDRRIWGKVGCFAHLL